MNNKMLKGLQIILLVLLLIILGGLISFFTRGVINESRGSNQGWWSWSWKNEINSEIKNEFIAPMTVAKEEEVKNEGIDRVAIDFASADIEIRVGDTDAFNIVESTNKPVDEDELCTIMNEKGVLTIKQKQKGSTTFWNNIWHKIEITVPKNYDKILSINTASGDILIVDDLTLSLLETKQASGELEIRGDIVVESFTSESASGDIEINKLTARSYTVSTASGEVGVGEIIGNGEITTASGDVTLTYIEVKDYAKVKTAAGSVAVNVREGMSAKISANTVAGDIEGNMDISYSGMIQKNAEVQIGEGNGAQIEIRTASGSIDINKVK